MIPKGHHGIEGSITNVTSVPSQLLLNVFPLLTRMTLFLMSQGSLMGKTVHVTELTEMKILYIMPRHMPMVTSQSLQNSPTIWTNVIHQRFPHPYGQWMFRMLLVQMTLVHTRGAKWSGTYFTFIWSRSRMNPSMYIQICHV